MLQHAALSAPKHSLAEEIQRVVVAVVEGLMGFLEIGTLAFAMHLTLEKLLGTADPVEFAGVELDPALVGGPVEVVGPALVVADLTLVEMVQKPALHLLLPPSVQPFAESTS